ncbi:hypothetical protein OPV22_005613 [Ensete ventricosum]|uniref:Uncharacterized protein n=1 Tax=Ensete ventricosum TaxID=4639 RepID=A0AAV8Q9K7_ENSVE|nr:hypothetical protein OPV22_005613 [Ensete ventricosum]
MAASHRKPPHALLVPYPLQGHIIPAVHLAIKLASRGFTITFVNTEAVHHQTCCAARRSGSYLGHDIFPAARASGLDIRYELVSDGLPVVFDRSLNHDRFMFAVLHVLSAHVEELIQKLSLRADPPLTCLIADTFFVWPSTLAKKFAIPYVSFWTEPALIFSLYYHMDLLIRNGHFASHDNSKDTITYVPGVAAIEPADLMSYLQETDVSTVVHQIIFKAFDEAKAADFVLCNTVQELESDTISALQREKPFYAVGPIFPAGFARSAVATSLSQQVVSQQLILSTFQIPKATRVWSSTTLEWIHVVIDGLVEVANRKGKLNVKLTNLRRAIPNSRLRYLCVHNTTIILMEGCDVRKHHLRVS